MNFEDVKAKCTGVSIVTINLGNEYSLTKEVNWLIEQVEKTERYEKALKKIATPGLGLGYWEAKKALEE
jgi:hypothetical protein